MNNWKDKLVDVYYEPTHRPVGELERFIETEIIEKLIEDAENADLMWPGELRAKWLGKE